MVRWLSNLTCWTAVLLLLLATAEAHLSSKAQALVRARLANEIDEASLQLLLRTEDADIEDAIESLVARPGGNRRLFSFNFGSLLCK